MQTMVTHIYRISTVRYLDVILWSIKKLNIPDKGYWLTGNGMKYGINEEFVKKKQKKGEGIFNIKFKSFW